MFAVFFMTYTISYSAIWDYIENEAWLWWNY
jgi:hypothetical protein